MDLAGAAIRQAAAVLLIAASLAIAGGQGAAETRDAEPAVIGLDHVPIAVGDLERAAAQYRSLGFSLKPGRPHANGIRNEHAKFTDGTELELITAPEARDDLTGTYRRHLAAGDGPAFLALYTRSRARVPATLAPPLSYIFFGPRNASPTDRPEHFAHANTAETFAAVWLAADDLSAERALFRDLGAAISRRDVHVPDRVSAEVATFAEGEAVLLPASHQQVRGRRIVGATLRVRSVAAARTLLLAARIPVRDVTAAGGQSVFVPPVAAHGLWLEFRQQPSR